MLNPTFDFVENYIEFIGGFRSYENQPLMLFETVEPPISLARYDVKIINSLSIQTGELNQPYTDKQADLAVKLIEKYKRQLFNLSPSVVLPSKLDNFRLGIRQIDRSKTVVLEDNHILVKFPYNTELIGTVRKLVTDSIGSVRFNSDTKVWHMDLTEWMVNWVMTVLPKYEFTIDPRIAQIYDRILQCENQNYKIILRQGADKFYLENANQSLVNYIDRNLGGFGLDNLLVLADNAHTLCYELDQCIIDDVKNHFASYEKFILDRKINAHLNEHSIDLILEYAKLTNRLPMYFYNTHTPKKDTPDMIYINNKVSESVTPKLLVTQTDVMIGIKKQTWLATAEKIIVLK